MKRDEKCVFRGEFRCLVCKKVCSILLNSTISIFSLSKILRLTTYRRVEVKESEERWTRAELGAMIEKKRRWRNGNNSIELLLSLSRRLSSGKNVHRIFKRLTKIAYYFSSSHAIDCSPQLFCEVELLCSIECVFMQSVQYFPKKNAHSQCRLIVISSGWQWGRFFSILHASLQLFCGCSFKGKWECSERNQRNNIKISVCNLMGFDSHPFLFYLEIVEKNKLPLRCLFCPHRCVVVVIFSYRWSRRERSVHTTTARDEEKLKGNHHCHPTLLYYVASMATAMKWLWARTRRLWWLRSLSAKAELWWWIVKDDELSLKSFSFTSFFSSWNAIPSRDEWRLNIFLSYNVALHSESAKIASCDKSPEKKIHRRRRFRERSFLRWNPYWIPNSGWTQWTSSFFIPS